MRKLLNLLKENSQNTYDFGCVMVYFNFPDLFKIQDVIDPKDVFEKDGDKVFGMEDEPHVTLLYGLHKEVSLEDVEEITSKYEFGPKPLIGTKISIFENEKYDVLKFDIEGEILYNINTDLKTLPFTSTYPDYHPHMTIGYLKKGMGQKWADKLKKIKVKLEPEYVIFSQADGTKNKIEINKVK